jgi:ABC-type nitrate/sulfonate/bicarbonate transport system substrate-binding protein
MPFRFSITPFYNTRQFYHGLNGGHVNPGFDLAIERNHSPVKDQKLVCGDLNATTMSMGKYVTAKLVSHTDVVPTDPVTVAAGLTYREGNGLFVRESESIETPTDLAGARVGIHDTTLAMTYHKAVLEERFDLDPSTIEWVVDTHQGLADRMDRGDLDAVERINDWYWAWRDGGEYRLLYDMAQEWERVHGYYPLVHLVSVDGDLASSAPDRIEQFVDALRASRAYLNDDREAVLETFVAEDGGEWTGERTVEALEHVCGGVDAPFELGEDQRRNVRDWTAYADRYDVFAAVPIPDDRLFPEPSERRNR